MVQSFVQTNGYDLTALEGRTTWINHVLKRKQAKEQKMSIMKLST